MVFVRGWSLALLLVSCSLASLLPVNPVQGQPKPAPPVIPPTYPTLTSAWNLGLKPGEKVDITLTGTNLADATGLWANFGGSISIPEGQKDATKLKVSLAPAKDTPPGIYYLRAATKKGISNLRPICVDPFPELASTGKNKSKTSPQLVPVPCVVTGAATSETAEYFNFPVVAGQPITIEVLGRRLGSPIDPVLVLYDAKGKELSGFYAEDTPGLMSDARAIYTPKQSGELIVEVRDSIFRGGADFTYRLRIGQFPGVMTAYPLNMERGKSGTMLFSGANTDSLPPVSVTAPADPLLVAFNVSPKNASGQVGWPVPVRLSNYPELTEKEPNNDLKAANALPVPGGISARFLDKNDVDFFKFTGKKGTKYSIAVETYERNSPAEVFVKVQDAKGTELTRSNPQNVPTRLEVTTPTDGDYYIVCEHTNYLSGPSEVYTVTIKPATPDFNIALSLDRLDVPTGSVGLIPISNITKLNGFNQPIEVSVIGDDISAKFTIPAGANPQAATPLYVPFQVKAGAKPGPRIVKVRASAKVDGQELVRLGTVFDATKAALGGIPVPPEELTTHLAVAITPEAPFNVAFIPAKVTIPQGGMVKGKLTVKWTGKTDEVVNMAVVTSAPNINAKLVPIAKGKTEAELELSATPQAAPGNSELYLKATAKIGGQDVSVLLAPITISVTEVKKKEEPKKKDEPKKK